jgi:hypothetical protein
LSVERGGCQLSGRCPVLHLGDVGRRAVAVGGHARDLDTCSTLEVSVPVPGAMSQTVGQSQSIQMSDRGTYVPEHHKT